MTYGLEHKDMIDGLDKSSTHLLKHAPVAKRKSASGTVNRGNIAHASEANASASSSASDKVSKEKN